MRSYLIGRIRSVLLIAAIASLSLALSPAPALAVDPSFTFKGGGWGHGIGMSQYGAQGYAKKGWKYSSILAHYYQGTKLVTKPTVKLRVNIEDGGASRTQWKIHAGGKHRAASWHRSPTPPSARRSARPARTGSPPRTAARRCAPTPQARRAGCSRPSRAGATPPQAGWFRCSARADRSTTRVSAGAARSTSSRRARPRTRRSRSTTSTSRSTSTASCLARAPRRGMPRRSRPKRSRRAPTPTKTAWSDGRSTAPRSRRSTTATRDPGHAHEAASTNAAVDATKGKLVWYGSQTEPVKTYFSSCSGGHTANIEDVWTNASPKPYYKGVADADGASPYYTWTSPSYSAKTVADKIRALDVARGGGLDYSVAAPAVVTGIATERAASGYTHHVRITWSTGKHLPAHRSDPAVRAAAAFVEVRRDSLLPAREQAALPGVRLATGLVRILAQALRKQALQRGHGLLQDRWLDSHGEVLGQRHRLDREEGADARQGRGLHRREARQGRRPLCRRGELRSHHLLDAVARHSARTRSSSRRSERSARPLLESPSQSTLSTS